MKLLNKSIQSWGKIFSVMLILSLLLSIVSIANHSSIQINIIILLVFSLVFMLLIGEDTKSQLSTSNYIITETLDNISVNDLPGVNKKDLMLALDKYELYKQSKDITDRKSLFDIVQVRYADSMKKDIVVDIIPNTQTESITGYITIHQTGTMDYIEIAQTKYYIAKLDGNSYPLNQQLNGKLCTLELLRPKVIPDLNETKHLSIKLPYLAQLSNWGVIGEDGKVVQHWGILSKIELVGDNK